MLSKQQKLRYGEILRQQMKEKQNKKRQEDMEKRGQQQANQKNNNYNEYQKQPIIQNQPVYYEKQNTNTRQFVDPKEQLIKKMEAQEYNPFGRGGGGAPNKKVPQQIVNTRNYSQPNQLYLNADQMQQMNFQNSNRNENSRVYTQQQLKRQNQYQQKYMQQQKNQNISPQTRNYYGDPYQKYPQQPQSYQNFPPSYNSIPQNGSYNQIPQNNYGGFNSRQDYVQSQLNRDNNNNNYGSKQQLNYVPQQQYNGGGYKNPNSNQNYPPLQDSYPNNSTKNYQPQQLNQNIPQQRTNTYENEQIQDVYKKGGRNLLKLQNQTVDQHLVKQRQKQQIQKYLKLQIQQAQRKKRQEKQRIKRQELQQERKQLQYIQQQKRKIQQQERKKQEEKQKVINQNLKNLEKRKELEEQAKRKIQMQNRNAQQRQRMEKQRQRQQNQPTQQRKKQSIDSYNDDRNQSRKFKISEEDATSVIESDTSEIEKGFNTQLSREFFKKQRQKDPTKQQHDKKLQAFTQQIQKMRGQINNQGEMFQQQIIKVKMEAERAQHEKRRAQQQIQRLKNQLKKKMDEDNQKLLRALQKTNNPQSRPPIQSHQRKLQRRLQEQEYDEIVQNQSKQYQNFSKNKPLRQKQNEKLVKKKFDVYQNNQNLERSNASGLMSLDGDSKKIPLYLQNANNLTMSQVEDFAKETQYFHKRQKSPKNQKQSQNNKPFQKNYNNNGFSESIVQVDQQRDYQSRKSNRQRNNNNSRSRLNEQKDQLDKMIESRQKSRGGWGQMSSVNSDITKQIQELLKKKDANINNRPSSISNAGKQSLARQGINYDGMSLHSINGGTLNSNNTLDIDRIYNRNQARLKQLKNLGVQTINTNNDDQLNKLDQLLNKYK